MPAQLRYYIADGFAPGCGQGRLVDMPPGGTSTVAVYTSTGWTTDAVASGYSLMQAGARKASSSFSGVVQPANPPISNDCFETVKGGVNNDGVLSGSIAAGTYLLGATFSSAVDSGTTGNPWFRLWRSVNPTGAGAVEISTGAVAGVADDGFNTIDSSAHTYRASFTLAGSVALNGEHLFLQVAWQITGAGPLTSDVEFALWPLKEVGSYCVASIITPVFTPSDGWVQGPYVSMVGAPSSGTGAITPVIPSTAVAGEDAFLVCECANDASLVLSSPQGFVEITNSPQGIGVADSVTATKISIFWKRLVGSDLNPTVADPGDHVIGYIVTFGNVVSIGNAWDITAGGTHAASTGATLPAVTTTETGNLIWLVLANPTDTLVGQTSNWVNAELDQLSALSDFSTNAGNGGGIGTAIGRQLSIGSTGTTAATLASSVVQAFMTVSLYSDVTGSLITSLGAMTLSATATVGPSMTTFPAYEIIDNGNSNKLAIDSHNQARGILYDAAGNVVIPTDKTAVPASQGYLPIHGLDNQKVTRSILSDSWGGLGEQDSQLIFYEGWGDGIVFQTSGSTNNGNMWSLMQGGANATYTTLPAPAYNGTLGDSFTFDIDPSNTTAVANRGSGRGMWMKTSPTATVGGDGWRATSGGRSATVFRTSVNVIWRERLVMDIGLANVTANPAALGLTNAITFRIHPETGNLMGIVAYNGVEWPTVLATRASMDPSTFYWLAFYATDDTVRWVVSDANNVPIADLTVYYPQITVASVFNLTHMQVFFRWAVPTTAAVIAEPLLRMGPISVERRRALPFKLWHHKRAGQLYDSKFDAVSSALAGAQYLELIKDSRGAAPAAITPTSGGTGQAFLCGQYRTNATVASEVDINVFGIIASPSPSGAVLHITGISIPPPITQGAAIGGTNTLLQWGIAFNGTTNSSGLRIPLPGYHLGLIGDAIGTIYRGSPIVWKPPSPITWLGGWISILYRVIAGTATTNQTIRGQVIIDGYWE